MNRIRRRFASIPFMKTRTPLILVLLACLVCTSAFADGEVTVQDSAGIVRGTASVEDLGQVRFQVENAQGLPADGAKITLTSAESGESFHAVSALGTVEFDGVAPGVWTVASETPGITFVDISIVPGFAAAAPVVGMSVGTTAAAVTGGGAVVAGGGIAIANSQDNNKEVLSPSS